jgi:hypothetical protein
MKEGKIGKYGRTEDRGIFLSQLDVWWKKEWKNGGKETKKKEKNKIRRKEKKKAESSHVTANICNFMG